MPSSASRRRIVNRTESFRWADGRDLRDLAPRLLPVGVESSTGIKVVTFFSVGAPPIYHLAIVHPSAHRRVPRVPNATSTTDRARPLAATHAVVVRSYYT